MKTLHLEAPPDQLDSPEARAAIRTAAEILRSGGTVAFPTETVYGLGANALDRAAVAKIFAAKSRPRWDPLIVHLADRSRVSSLSDDVSESASQLMHAFWPGPLTLLLPRNPSVPDAVTAGRALVGIRVPSHPVAHALIAEAGIPIAAPSANRFGHTSPTTAAHVIEDLDGRIDAVLDGGATTHGLESTVMDPDANPPVVYRPGVVTLEQIRTLCPDAVVYAEQPAAGGKTPASLPSPGVGVRHYAPRARLVLIGGDGPGQREQLAAAALAAEQSGETLGLMLPDSFAVADGARTRIYRWGAWANREELAERLYAGLRALDREGVTVILCPLPDEQGIGRALRDRLGKAARTS